MTDEELKAAALVLAEKLLTKSIRRLDIKNSLIDIIIAEFQPLVDADRLKIERLEKALTYAHVGFCHIRERIITMPREGTAKREQALIDIDKVAVVHRRQTFTALGEDTPAIKQTKDRIVSGSGDENRHEDSLGEEN